MTAPMPETMSPREKVARIVEPDAWSTKDVMKWHGLVVLDVETKSAIDFSLSVYEPILAALASSGDHAELARLAEAANVEMPSKRRSGWYRRQSEFAHAANPATVLALIAEVAALRESIGRHDRQVAGMLRARLAAETRATEAERKLAEAVGLLRRLAEVPSDEYDAPAEARAIRHFLSKEAEPCCDARDMHDRLTDVVAVWDHTLLDGKVEPTNYGVCKAVAERIPGLSKVRVWRGGKVPCGAEVVL